MLTLALYGLLAIIIAAVLFLVAAYLLPAGEQIAPPIRDEPIWALPADRALDSEDIAGVRLPVALRGYRFAETDLLLDRLGDELKSRDEEIARLRATAADRGERFAEVDPAGEQWQPPAEGLGGPAGESDPEPDPQSDPETAQRSVDDV